MNKNIKLFALLFFIGLIMNAQTKMSATEALILKKAVKAQAEETKTIESDFIQYKHLDFLSNDIVTYGKLAFKMPALVKWEYYKPYKYAVVFKEETLYVNDEGKKSNINVGASKLFKQLNKFIISSVKGDMFNEKEFVISYFKNAPYNEVHFEPINSKLKQYIKAFHISFTTKGEVVMLKMIEPTNDYTKIEFKDRMINKSIPDAVFSH